MEAFANQASCQAKQEVELQARLPGRVTYRTMRKLTTGSTGLFSLRLKPRATYVYRARVEQTTLCLGAVSDRLTVKVRARRRR